MSGNGYEDVGCLEASAEELLIIEAFRDNYCSTKKAKRFLNLLIIGKDILMILLTVVIAKLLSMALGGVPVLVLVLLIIPFWGFYGFMELPWDRCKTKWDVENGTKYEYTFIKRYINESLNLYKGVVVENMFDSENEESETGHVVMLKIIYKGYIEAWVNNDVYEELSTAFKNKCCKRVFVAEWKWLRGIKLTL